MDRTIFKELLNQSIQNGEPVMTLHEMKEIIDASCLIRDEDKIIPNIIQEYNEMSIELTEQMIHDKSDEDLHYGLLEELADTCMSPFYVMRIFSITQDELMRALTVKLKRHKEKLKRIMDEEIPKYNPPIQFSLKWSSPSLETYTIRYDYDAFRFSEVFLKQIIDSGVLYSADSISYIIYYGKDSSFETVIKNDSCKDVVKMLSRIGDHEAEDPITNGDANIAVYEAAGLVKEMCKDGALEPKVALVNEE